MHFDTDEVFLWHRFFHLMDDMRFGCNDQRLTFHFLGIFEDAAGRADIVGMVDNIGRAFRVRGHRGIGMLRLELDQLGLAERFMDDADAWLAEFYADDSAGVRSARTTIAEVRDSVLQVAMPDISGSLRLLRQFNALSDAAADAEPAAESGQEQ